jgi:hypothetical protein
MKSVYAAGMDTNRTPATQSGFDRQVGALLDRAHESGSIVDSLMAMPLPDGEDAPREWNSAVTRRLERRLADAMRVIIEGEPTGKNSP